MDEMVIIINKDCTTARFVRDNIGELPAFVEYADSVKEPFIEAVSHCYPFPHPSMIESYIVHADRRTYNFKLEDGMEVGEGETKDPTLDYFFAIKGRRGWIIGFPFSICLLIDNDTGKHEVFRFD